MDDGWADLDIASVYDQVAADPGDPKAPDPAGDPR
jgi:hypothetical protein